MPANTVIWLWIGNLPAISPDAATNVTQTELNAAGMPGYSVTGGQQIAPVNVTGTRTFVSGLGQVFTAPFNPTNGFVSQFSFDSPSTPGTVSGQTIQAAFRASVTITAPDGTQQTQIATVIQMSNGDVFLRPNPNFLDGWDTIGAVQTITLDTVQPFPNNTVFNSTISFNPSIFDLPIVCFAAGTQILTRRGEVAVEDLAPGDEVLTADNGFEPLVWVGGRHVTAAELRAKPNLRPIRIKAGALGQGVPVRDLVVSPQHRVMLRSDIARGMFGVVEVLVPAVHLLHLPGVARINPAKGVTYHHVLCARHEVLFANGAPTESLYAGPMALKALGPEAVAEISEILPEALIEAARPARYLPPGKQVRALTAQLRQQGKDLLAA